MDSSQDYRYERKFFVSELTKPEIESIVKLHPAVFSEIYHERFVNNLYLDSFDMRHYSESVAGLTDRLKVRVRWYGDLFGLIEEPFLELKIKQHSLGKKERFPLVPFTLDQSFQAETLMRMWRRSDIPDDLKLELATLQASLLNRYRRKYFESANRKYRITIDSALEFYQIRTGKNTFLHKSVDPVSTVVELKYEPQGDDNARWITSYFPLRMTKSSKYAIGIERLCWW